MSSSLVFRNNLWKWLIVILATTTTTRPETIYQLSSMYKSCDFHLTVDTSNKSLIDFTEEFLFRARYSQAWTVYTIESRLEEIEIENENLTMTSKEVCDFNTFIADHDEFGGEMLNSFRGNRQHSTFHFIDLDSTPEEGIEIGLMYLFSARVFLTVKSDSSDNLHTYGSFAHGVHQLTKVTINGNSTDLWRRHPTQAFGHRVSYSTEVDIDAEFTNCYLSVSSVSQKYSRNCTMEQKIFSTLAHYKNITYDNLDESKPSDWIFPGQIGRDNSDSCGEVGRLTETVFFISFPSMRKSIVVAKNRNILFYCDQNRQSSAAEYNSAWSIDTWFKAFELISWLLIAAAYILLSLYLILFNQIETKKRRNRYSSWLSSFSLFLRQDPVPISNKVMLLYVFFSFVILALYECFVSSESIVPPAKPNISSFAELVEKGYKLQSLTFVGFDYELQDNILDDLEEQDWAEYKIKNIQTFLNKSDINLQQYVEDDKTNRILAYLLLYSGFYNNGNIQSKTFFLFTEMIKEVIESGPLCKSIENRTPIIENPIALLNDSDKYEFVGCYSEILRSGVQTLLEVGIGELAKSDWLSGFNKVRIENAIYNYKYLQPVRARIYGIISSPFMMLLLLLCIPYLFFHIEFVVYYKDNILAFIIHCYEMFRRKPKQLSVILKTLQERLRRKLNYRRYGVGIYKTRINPLTAFNNQFCNVMSQEPNLGSQLIVAIETHNEYVLAEKLSIILTAAVTVTENGANDTDDSVDNT